MAKVPELKSAPLGVVLAGGVGRRMGGNKSCRLVNGRRLIDSALESLAGVCPRRVVVTGDVASLADLSCAVIADRWPGQGPLAALATAFLDTQAESIIVLACGHALCKAVAFAPFGPDRPRPKGRCRLKPPGARASFSVLPPSMSAGRPASFGKRGAASPLSAQGWFGRVSCPPRRWPPRTPRGLVCSMLITPRTSNRRKIFRN